MDSANDKVLDRIKKLLALAGSGNQHESEGAAREAARLMALHHISQATVEEGSARRIRVIHAQAQGGEKSRQTVWHGILCKAIGDALHCSVTVTPGSDRVNVTGPDGDVAVVCALYASLKSQLSAACDRAWDRLDNAQRMLAKHRGGKSRYVETFMWAAADAIKARLAEGASAATREAGGNALVLLSTYARSAETAIAAWRREQGMVVRSVSGPARRSAGDFAASAGRAAGQSADLTRRPRALGA